MEAGKRNSLRSRQVCGWFPTERLLLDVSQCSVVKTLFVMIDDFQK